MAKDSKREQVQAMLDEAENDLEEHSINCNDTRAGFEFEDTRTAYKVGWYECLVDVMEILDEN